MSGVEDLILLFVGFLIGLLGGTTSLDGAGNPEDMTTNSPEKQRDQPLKESEVVGCSGHGDPDARHAHGDAQHEDAEQNPS